MTWHGTKKKKLEYRNKIFNVLSSGAQRLRTLSSGIPEKFKSSVRWSTGVQQTTEVEEIDYEQFQDSTLDHDKEDKDYEEKIEPYDEIDGSLYTPSMTKQCCSTKSVVLQKLLKYKTETYSILINDQLVKIGEGKALAWGFVMIKVVWNLKKKRGRDNRMNEQ